MKIIQINKFKIAEWTFDELVRVFQWIYPSDYDFIKPNKIDDLPKHFLTILKLNTKSRWLWLTTREHGLNVHLKTFRRIGRINYGG